MRRLDKHDRVDVVASQQHGVIERTGVTLDEAEMAAWAVGDDGSKVGGARGVALALAVGRDSVLPTLPWKVPGMPWVLDRVYETVARNRRRLPGDTPWCVVHDGECTTSDH
jgi:predicted DCC family thiol-disulfide oxidoreductase YuxK